MSGLLGPAAGPFGDEDPDILRRLGLVPPAPDPRAEGVAPFSGLPPTPGYAEASTAALLRPHDFPGMVAQMRDDLAGTPGASGYEPGSGISRAMQGFAMGAPSPFRGVSRRASGQRILYSSGDEVQPPATPPEGTPASPAVAPRRAWPQQDAEGRPLTAEQIAGRDVAGTFHPLTTGDTSAVLDALARAGVTRNDSTLPRRVFGQVRVPESEWGQGERTLDALRAQIAPGQGRATEAHEIGHIVHMMRTGDARLPSPVQRELSRIVSGGGYDPRGARYRNELYANAMERYLTDPEWVHRSAPRAAALLRSHVNSDPILSRYFQLNTVLPWLAASGLLGGGGALLDSGASDQ